MRTQGPIRILPQHLPFVSLPASRRPALASHRSVVVDAQAHTFTEVLTMKRILAIFFALGAIASAPAYGADETATDNVPAPGASGRFTVVSLEIGIAALQAYDGYSTVAAINRGATESNAIMSGLVSHPPAFLVVKGALAGVTIVT